MKRFFHLLSVFSILLAMIIPLVGSPALASTATIYSNSGDGGLSQGAFVYNDAWSASSGIVSTANPWNRVGQYYTGSAYVIDRAVLYFDTSSIPVGAVVDNATLKLWGIEDTSTTDFNLTIQNGQPTYPRSPVQDTDFDRSLYSGDGGSVTTAGFSVGGYNTITLNSTGLSWITTGGTTKFMIRSSRDINGDVPTGNEWVSVAMSEYTGTASDPKLEIGYHMPPVVTTNSATLVGSTTATVNGVITNIGDDNVTLRGFEWGTSSGVYTANQTTSSNYTVGSFSDNLTLLTDNTTYYFRALAQNLQGTGYGGELTFTTNNITGVSVSTNPVTNVSTTTAILQGTLQSLGNAPFVSVSFEYGTSTSYGTTTAEVDVITAGTFNASLTGLSYNRTYHYRAVARYGTAYFYGADRYFTTLAATGSSTDLQIISIAAFQNYIQTGDMLFTAEVINKYTGYYPTQNPAKYFMVQLLDLTATNVLAAVPLPNWGDRPIGIYVNAAQAAGLSAGEAYYIRMIGLGIPSQPSVTRQLTTADWYGYDLDELDEWAIGTALNMQLTDNRLDYTKLLTDVGIVINNPAAGYFTTGIAGIGEVRPNLFTESVRSASFPTGVATNTWDDPTAWQTFFGPIITADVGVMGVPLGITGKDFLAGIIMFSILGCVMIVVGATGGWGALGAAMICLPILWLGVYARVVEIAVLVAIVIIAGAIAIRQFVVKTL